MLQMCVVTGQPLLLLASLSQHRSGPDLLELFWKKTVCVVPRR